MKNDNEAKCHEEGMHRRAGPDPFTNFHANVHDHAQRQCLKLQKMKRRLASMLFDESITQPLCYPC